MGVIMKNKLSKIIKIVVTVLLITVSSAEAMMSRLGSLGAKRACFAAGSALCVGAMVYAQQQYGMQHKTVCKGSLENRAPKVLQFHQPSSIWAKIIDREIPRRARIGSFVNDCCAMQKENERIPRHEKNDSTVRIATYNVHGWHNPYGWDRRCYNHNKIASVMNSMNADVLVVQEVGSETDLKQFEVWGYSHRLESVCGQNAILSKYPLKMVSNSIFEGDVHRGRMQARSLMHVEVTLPNNKVVSLYGTHLDVYDATENVRLGEIEEIVKKADADINCNKVVLADFNAVRRSDYQYSINGHLVWDILNRSEKQRTKVETQTRALETLEQGGFRDCFAHANIAAPKFSVWSGTLIDFIYLDKKWQLPVTGCYALYSKESDHIPIIMDVCVQQC